MTSQPSQHTVRAIAVDSITDPRSVRKALRGELVRGSAGERIARALAAHGITPRSAA